MKRRDLALINNLVLLTYFVLMPIYGFPYVSALSPEQRGIFNSGILDFDIGFTPSTCSATPLSDDVKSINNSDYAGSPVLTEAQITQIKDNQSFYEEAAKEHDIPWQMIAVIHLRESGLKRSNPGNGQGIYQFVNKNGGPYPTGPVSDQEFLRQTKLAAAFIKSKVNSNYPENRVLSYEDSSVEAIKDTFYSYNGRAYLSQARSLGFDKGYEGSPYVMTKFDSQRDPDVNPTGWGQIKRDHGSIEYPANKQHGAFVIYSVLAGLPISCGSGEFVWPEKTSVSITSCYGPRIHPITGDSRMHRGIDIVGGAGTPILATASGEVVIAGPMGGYGPYFVVIQHDNGYGSSYGHMSSMSVKRGDAVQAGQEIGKEGSLGMSSGSHLHFNIFEGDYPGNDSKNINPLQAGLVIPEEVANPKGCK